MSQPFFEFDACIASAKQDGERVTALAQRLRTAGLEVVVPQEMLLPGDLVIDRISTFIGGSRTGLVVFSRAALTDRWVQEQYQVFMHRAVQLGRKLIPILIDDVRLPSFASTREPSDLQDIGARDYDERIAKLVEAIRDGEVEQANTGGHVFLPSDALEVAQELPRVPPADKIGAEADHGLLLRDIVSELGDAVTPVELPVGRLRWAWYSALGILAPELGGSARNSQDLIREAADVVLPADQPLALFSVAEYIAAASNGVTAKSIRQSITRLAERYLLSLPPPATPPPQASSGAVLVRLIPNAPGSKRYRVEVSTYFDLTAPGYQLDLPEIAQPIRAIKARVGRTISEALKKIDDTGGTTLIEFLLPRALLNEPVEDWHLEKTIQKVGNLYPVVVRDIELPGFAHGKSLGRWSYLLKTGLNQGSSITQLSCMDSLTPEQLTAQFELDPSRAVLVLHFQPSKSRGWDMLDAAFAAGVPVIVWPRLNCSCRSKPEKICPGEVFSDDFARRIHDEPVTELPWLVKRFRNEAALSTAEASHCGRGLVLLWHDPNRKIAELIPLRGPQMDEA